MRPLTMLCLLSHCTLLGQTFTGRITGVVHDSTGAAVPSSSVTAHQIETGAKWKTATDATGVYDVPLLLPGTYELTVEASGMEAMTRREIKLEVNSAVTVDFTLKPGAGATVVDITSETPVLQTETSGAGTTVEMRVVEDFPLPERDVMGLVRAIPGIIANSTYVGLARASRNVFESTFAVAGGRTSMNEVLLDGSPNTIGDFNGVVVVPPQDSVQEFRVESASYGAEFGRTGGGTVNIVTKAGTNDYHGTLYYYHQNDELNANGFFNNRNHLPRQFLRRHQYGYNFGGPVWIPMLYRDRNKTFFFSSFEGRRESNPISDPASVPTAAQLSGDFSQTMFMGSDGQGQQVVIYDPESTRDVNGTLTRTPFPGNRIPKDRLNLVALAVLKYYPAPNVTAAPIIGAINYSFVGAGRYSRDVTSNRVDQYFGAEHRLFFRFTLQENLYTSPISIVRFPDPSSPNWEHFKNFAIDDTWKATSRLHNIFRYSYTRYHANLLSNTLGFDPTTLGLPTYIRDSANILLFPTFNIDRFPRLSGGSYNNQPRDTQGIQDSVVYLHGSHNLKAGAEYRLLRFYPFQPTNPTGNFSFSATDTQSNPLGATSKTEGFGLASMLLGVGQFSVDHVEALSAYHHYAGAYVQDDWKLTPRLTINLGLRWEAETGTAEAHNRLSYFDPDALNAWGGKGALLFTGGANPRTIRATNWRNFGPRVGFAWRPYDRWVVRGAYGIFYLPIGLEPTLPSTPFKYTLKTSGLGTDYTPNATLSNPFPDGLAKPNSANPVNDGSYLLGMNATVVLRNQPSEYAQQWNFAIARQLARTSVITVTYIGSRGVHLPIASLELNQINPSYLKLGGDFLTEPVPNPYYGRIADDRSLLSLSSIPREQLLKPFPTFAGPSIANAFDGSLIYERPPVGDSIYHALTVQFERRFTRGLAVSAHYTFSKLIDVGGAGNGAAIFEPIESLRDVYNTRLERSLGAYDVPHRLVVIYAVDLPFGRAGALGRAWFQGSKWARRITGGWQLLGVHTLQSGLPVSVGGTDVSELAGAMPSRASVVPGQKDSLPYETSIANARAYNPSCNCTRPWFNPGAFTATPQYVIPNGPRFLPDVRQGFLRQWDLTVTKNISMREGVRLGLQAKFYNLLNQVTFAGPNMTDVGDPYFGSAPGISSNPRYVELGAKLSF